MNRMSAICKVARIAVLIVLQCTVSYADSHLERSAEPTRLSSKRDQHTKHLYDNAEYSHDGTKLAFMVHDLDAFNTCTIWILHPETGVYQQVTSADSAGMGDWMPSWSPDDQRIAFVSNRGGSWNISTVSVDGENLRNHTESLHSATNSLSDLTISSPPSWAPDGTRLVFSGAVADNHDLYSVDLNTDTVTRLTDTSENERWPLWSPDGESILFTISEGTTEFYFLDISSGRIRHFPTALDNLVNWPSFEFSPDGQWLALTVENPGVGWATSCSIVSLSSGKVYPVPAPTVDGEEYSTWAPSWHSDGRHLSLSAMPKQQASARIKVLELASMESRTLVDSLNEVEGMAWSPDGSQLAFGTIPRDEIPASTDPDTIVALASLTSPPTIKSLARGSRPDWSSDGSTIAFIASVKDESTIGVYHVQDEQITHVQPDVSGAIRALAFSPEGDLLAYVIASDGEEELWIYDLLSEDHLQLTYSGGQKALKGAAADQYHLQWSPDGEQLVFVHKDKKAATETLWMVPAFGGKNTPVTPDEANDRSPMFSGSSGDVLYYSSFRSNRWEIWETDFDQGQKSVFRASANAYPIIRVGSRLFFYQAHNTDIKNWTDIAFYDLSTGEIEIATKEEQHVYAAEPHVASNRFAFADVIETKWREGNLWNIEVGHLLKEHHLP